VERGVDPGEPEQLRKPVRKEEREPSIRRSSCKAWACEIRENAYKSRSYRDLSRMSAHEYTILVTELDAGGKDYRFEVRPAWIRGALEGHEASASETDGVLAVRASKSGHDVVVHGTIDATLSIPCARCLEPTKLPVHSDVSVIYVPGSRLKRDGNDDELSEEEANTLPFDGDTVVLDDLVRDELVLEIPMIPLCSEDCPGMSPAPNQQQAEAAEGSSNKAIDPRLLPLLDFKKSTKSQ